MFITLKLSVITKMLCENLAILDPKKGVKSIIPAYKDNEITILSKG